MAAGQIEKKGALDRELAQIRFCRLYRDQGRAILAYAPRRNRSVLQWSGLAVVTVVAIGLVAARAAALASASPFA